MAQNQSKNSALKADQWYEVDRASGFLGVKADTIKGYLRNGKLKGKKVGPKQCWRVTGAEIIRLMKLWDGEGV